LRRFRRGKPIYLLSPAGVHYRGPGIKEILIPWHEIEGVDTIDITWRHWMARRTQLLTSRGVVVVLVSKPFYDAHIHRGLFWRGPYWYETKFIPKGDLIQCALHSEIVSVAPRDLRHAVESRWRAFRDQPAPGRPAGASVPSVAAGWRSRLRRGAPPEPRIVAASGKPRPISWWSWVKIALPLIGIVVVGSNLLGLWATEAQTEAYAKKKEWQEWRARNAAERKEMDERLKKQRQEIDDLMRRTFGR
jgi:hypothetical protein